MTHPRLLLALGLALAGAFAPGAAEAQFDLAAPTFHEVHLLAQDGRHDGTESTVWVRIYSQDQGAWSSWKPIAGGVPAGAVTSLTFETAPSFTHVSRVQVWEGASDGLRVSVRVRSSNAVTQRGVESRVWIKNGSATFDLAEVLAYECDGPPTVCSCDIDSGDCFALWLSGLCDQDSWECYDYSSDAGGGQFCTCLP
ncbi:MAG TPA: hypothetical protein RMH85_10660 [Polyangiaceae bacterium LLY-WYZ-15_(1-7)]|nr:hypothetical protein [Myxococcales bacterium]MAT25463.1 hypothetical protein [Sandaracinus sp.]HJK91870.1 hypothetical protein [Polyangiaceae bacterium LLY-WYZ-15_(1-7)]MBJ73936.1 hypothetical protein [Sandaracinus sp.]HJL00695.1 hypothetical protein [Polyangiaceae bacterium LLY-WYZ-15_(1-7)]